MTLLKEYRDVRPDGTELNRVQAPYETITLIMTEDYAGDWRREVREVQPDPPWETEWRTTLVHNATGRYLVEQLSAGDGVNPPLLRLIPLEIPGHVTASLTWEE